MAAERHTRLRSAGACTTVSGITWNKGRTAVATAKTKGTRERRGGPQKRRKELPKVSTGIAGLDLVLGGGLARRTRDPSQRWSRERAKV